MITLPNPPQPLGTYVRAVRSGNLLFLSGMLPLRDGKPAYSGRIGDQLDSAQAREAARLAMLNGLSAIQAELGSLDDLVQVVRLSVYLQTADWFREHAEIADAASELLREVVGERASHARLVFGALTLPSSMPVEIELIVETKTQTGEHS